MQLAMYFTGMVCGLFIGAMLWEVLYAGPAYRRAQVREFRLNDRLRAWQRMWLVEYAATQREQTNAAMDEIHDNDNHSRKVPHLEMPGLTVVK